MTPITADELASLLGLSPACLLLLDRAGRVLHGNAAAERLFAQQAVLCLRDSTLHARRKDEDKLVQDAMAKLSVADPTGSLCLRSREGFPVVLLDLHRLGNGRVVARLTDLTARPIPSTDRMRSVLGLTRAEARVASAMLSGLGLSAIADQHGVEAETVRSQAKRIRAKAGARSQNQLLGILSAIGLAPEIAPPGKSESPVFADQEDA
jgi:DNA-binding CsgD family transcriptional regulator